MKVNTYIKQYLDNIFNTNTIDSFRPRYSNSHIALEEIRFVCQGIENGRAKDGYIKSLIEEAREYLNKDVILNKNAENKNRRDVILKQISSFKNATHLKQYLSIELKYFESIYFKEMASLFLFYSDKRKNIELNLKLKEELRKLINSFISECIYKGLSFKYLREVFLKLTNNYSKSDLNSIIKKISGKNKFNLYLLVENVDEKIVSFFISSIKGDGLKVYRRWPKSIEKKIHKKLKLEKRKKNSTLIFNIKDFHKDEYSALLYFRNSLGYLINLTHMINPDKPLRFFHTGLVYDYSNRRYRAINYENIVTYKYRVDFDNFRDKLIYCHETEGDIRNKISTSVAYLDSCLNEHRVANRFLNSWISIEVLFNTLKEEREKQGGTIDYFYEYIPVISSVFYVNKIMNYLGNRAYDYLKKNRSIKIRKQISDGKGKFNLSNFIKFLRDDGNFLELKEKIGKRVELIHKIEYFRDIIFDYKKLANLLRKHKITIYYHLKRLYRIRNDIVHGDEKRNIISSEGLFNLTSVKMLSINNQEYATETIDKIAKYCFLNKKFKISKKEKLKLIDIFEFFNSSLDLIISKLEDDKMNEKDNDFEKILDPFKFLV